VICLNRDYCDYTDFNKLENAIKDLKFDYLINAAGWTNVDTAESNSSEVFLINCALPELLAEICVQMDSHLIHFSSDFIFEGLKNGPYETHETGSPVNIYGDSKLCAELKIKSKEGLKYWIIRTAWLYGSTNKDFVHRIKSKIGVEKEIEVVDDQFGHPTFIGDVVEHLALMIKWQLKKGTYHLVNSGVASRFELSKQVCQILDLDSAIKIYPIKTKEKLGVAKRPGRVELDLTFWENNNLIKMRDWKEALRFKLENEKTR